MEISPSTKIARCDMDKEKQILQYMEKLKISRKEAEELWEDDQEDFIGDEGEEMTKKAKEVIRVIHKAGDKTTREKAKRERKVNSEKATLLEILKLALAEKGITSEVTTVEKILSFEYSGKKFEFNLIQKREPKK